MGCIARIYSNLSAVPGGYLDGPEDLRGFARDILVHAIRHWDTCIKNIGGPAHPSAAHISDKLGHIIGFWDEAGKPSAEI